MHQKEYTTVRRVYAWIGFTTVLIAVCAILYGIGYVFTATDSPERTEAFYQQTEINQD